MVLCAHELDALDRRPLHAYPLENAQFCSLVSLLKGKLALYQQARYYTYKIRARGRTVRARDGNCTLGARGEERSVAQSWLTGELAKVNAPQPM